MQAHKYVAHYANSCARIIRRANVRRRDARFAHSVYLYATIDRAHSYMVLGRNARTQHRFIVSLCSPRGYRGVYRRYYFTVCRSGGGAFRRAHLAPFCSALFTPSLSRHLIRLSLFLPLSFSLSPFADPFFFPVALYRKQRDRERGRRGRKGQSANTFGGQSVIFISESFAPFIRDSREGTPAFSPFLSLNFSVFLPRAQPSHSYFSLLSRLK